MEASLKKKKFFEGSKKALTVGAFLLPYMAIFIIFFVYPFFYGIYISFFKWNIYDVGSSQFVWFDNYKRILFQEGVVSRYFWTGLGNTLIFVAISVPLLIIVPLIIALLLDIEPRGYKIFRVIFFLPTVLSVSAVCLIWKWQFDANSGFINALLNVFGIKSIAWLNTQPWAWIAVLITTIWWTMGTNMVILGAALKDVDKTLYEAAELDGCSYPQVLRHISIPSIKNQMFLCMITTIIASFNVYGQTDILTEGGPANSTTVLLMRIRGFAFGTNSQPGIAAAMAICMGIIIIIIGVIQNVVMKRMK